jgi:hypothetical protein
MKNRRRKGIRGLVLALAIAALVAPAANGKIYLTKTGAEVAPGYSQQALKAMNARWSKLADYYQHKHSYTPQALQAMNQRWTARAAAYKVAVAPDDRGGIRGAGPSVERSDYADRQLANLQAKAALVAQAFHVDDRAGVRGPGPVETPVVVAIHGGGFDWTDAGIGAAIAAFTAAVLLGGAAMTRRRRAGLAV